MRSRDLALSASLVCILICASMATEAVARASAVTDRPSAHRMLGALPVRTAASTSRDLGSGNLTYHGGPVMRTIKTYAIHWLPSGYTMQSGYRSEINSYLSGSAADSGKTTNVYSTETQYYDTTGKIAYSQTFGGSTTSTAAFPPNGCPSYGGFKVCLSDAQIINQIRTVMTNKGWIASSNRAFMLFLPRGVGTCFDPNGQDCAFTTFCAYHSWLGSGAGVLIYANVPYADTMPTVCGTGQRPYGNDADETLNVASHEHREMIEDPDGNAWYDAAGYEGSDKCSWTFGSALGSTPTGKYNQVIATKYYWLQEEWSNAGSRCVQRGY
jgi:hypothetical protein